MKFKLVFYIQHSGRPEGHTAAVDWLQCPFEIDPAKMAEYGKAQKVAVPGLTDEQVAIFEREMVGEIIEEAMLAMKTSAKLAVHEHVVTAIAREPAVVG